MRKGRPKVKGILLSNIHDIIAKCQCNIAPNEHYFYIVKLLLKELIFIFYVLGYTLFFLLLLKV